MPNHDYEIEYIPTINMLDHSWALKIKPGDTWRLWRAGGIPRDSFIHVRIKDKVKYMVQRHGWRADVRWSGGDVFVQRHENHPGFTEAQKKVRKAKPAKKGRPEKYADLRRIRPGQRRLYSLESIPSANSLEARALRAAVGRLRKADPSRQIFTRWTRNGMMVFREKPQAPKV